MHPTEGPATIGRKWHRRTERQPPHTSDLIKHIMVNVRFGYRGNSSRIHPGTLGGIEYGRRTAVNDSFRRGEGLWRAGADRQLQSAPCPCPPRPPLRTGRQSVAVVRNSFGRASSGSPRKPPGRPPLGSRRAPPLNTRYN